MGKHTIKTRAKTQAVIAKSSAESELYGVVRGACEALGVKTLCKDLGGELSIRLELDATVAKGILNRQGIAKVRHIDVNCLAARAVCQEDGSIGERAGRDKYGRFDDQAFGKSNDTPTFEESQHEA